MKKFEELVDTLQGVLQEIELYNVEEKHICSIEEKDIKFQVSLKLYLEQIESGIEKEEQLLMEIENH